MSRRTAHWDTFVLEGLPPPQQLPEFLLDRPEYRYPAQLNAAAVLLDGALARGWGERPALRVLAEDCEIACTYAQLAAQVNRIAHVLVQDLGLIPGNRVLLRWRQAFEHEGVPMDGASAHGALRSSSRAMISRWTSLAPS